MNPKVFSTQARIYRQQLRMETPQSHGLFAHGRGARVPPLSKHSQAINYSLEFSFFSFGHEHETQRRDGGVIKFL